MVIKEWECPVHGAFDSTHPVCLEVGCDAECKQVFRTPVGLLSDFHKRFDQGIRKSSDLMGIGDFKSARAGESSFAGRAEQGGVLWGADVQKVLGVNVEQLTAAAARPLKVTYRDGHTESVNTSVMQELANEGATHNVLPRPAELTGDRRERVKRR
jgi:hypothetical protein